MPETRNRAAVERYFTELLNGHEIDMADEILHLDVIFRNPITVAQGRDAYKRFLKEDFVAFPDNKFGMDYVLAEDHHVVCRATYRATFQAPYFRLPPTHRRFVLPIFVGFIFDTTAITDIEMSWDMRSMSEQIGSVLREKRL